jgi:hypothetical protein
MCRKQVLIYTALLALCLPVLAHGDQILEADQVIKVQVKARTLYGRVSIEGRGIKDVNVSECDKTYTDCRPVITTPASGEFTVQGKFVGKTRYLRFVTSGMEGKHVNVDFDRPTSFLAIVLRDVP